MTQRYAEREQPVRSEGNDLATRSEGSDLAAPEPRSRTTAVTRQEFSAGFERCFGRVYAYVSRRVSDRETCERIVSQVLTGSLDLLVGRVDERRELSRLKVSSDRLIGREAASRAPTGAGEP